MEPIKIIDENLDIDFSYNDVVDSVNFDKYCGPKPHRIFKPLYRLASIFAMVLFFVFVVPVFFIKTTYGITGNNSSDGRPSAPTTNIPYETTSISPGVTDSNEQDNGIEWTRLDFALGSANIAKGYTYLDGKKYSYVITAIQNDDCIKTIINVYDEQNNSIPNILISFKADSGIQSIYRKSSGITYASDLISTSSDDGYITYSSVNGSGAVEVNFDKENFDLNDLKMVIIVNEKTSRTIYG